LAPLALGCTESNPSYVPNLDLHLPPVPDGGSRDLAGADRPVVLDLAVSDQTMTAPDATLCGQIGEACCGGKLCGAGLACAGGFCQFCGAGGMSPPQPCCPGNVCNNGACCNGQTCVAPNSSCGGTSLCIGGQCQGCGNAGQPCCNGACSSGGCCMNGTQ